MNNLLKVLIAILAIVLLAGAVVIIGGLAYFLPVERSSGVEEAFVWEESSQNEFVSESYSYKDSFKFIYTPADPNALLDCYVSYYFQKNGNMQENADRKLYEDVSDKNPISLEFPKEKGYRYKLEVIIEDKNGTVLHKSGVEIHSDSEKMR